MRTSTENLVQISRANADFGYVARNCDSHDYSLILRHGSPAYVLIKVDRLGEALDKMGFDIVARQ